MVPIKFLSNFCRTLEVPLINCELSLQLKWSRNCIIVASTANNLNPAFQINDTKLDVPVVTLSTHENIKLLKQLESGFKRANDWNKYLAKTSNQASGRYLDYLIDPSFQGLFVLSFEDDYLTTVEVKGYNVMADGRNFSDQQIKNDLKTYDNIRKVAMGQGGDYATGCLLDYPYFKEYYKLIAIDLSKQKLDADPKAIRQIDFIGNLDRAEDSTMFFIIEVAEETVLDQKEHLIMILFRFNIILIQK